MDAVNSDNSQVSSELGALDENHMTSGGSSTVELVQISRKALQQGSAPFYQSLWTGRNVNSVFFVLFSNK